MLVGYPKRDVDLTGSRQFLALLGDSSYNPCKAIPNPGGFGESTVETFEILSQTFHLPSPMKRLLKVASTSWVWGPQLDGVCARKMPLETKPARDMMAATCSGLHSRPLGVLWLLSYLHQQQGLLPRKAKGLGCAASRLTTEVQKMNLNSKCFFIFQPFQEYTVYRIEYPPEFPDPGGGLLREHLSGGYPTCYWRFLRLDGSRMSARCDMSPCGSSCQQHLVSMT